MGRSKITLADLKVMGVVEVDGKFYGPKTPQAMAEKTKKKEKKKRKAVGGKDKIDPFLVLVKLELGIEMVKEHKFHPERQWRFDYAYPDGMIALEVEGGVWTGGRHTRGAGYIGDMEKYNAANALGWRLIRIVPDDLMTLQTLEMIKELLESNN